MPILSAIVRGDDTSDASERRDGPSEFRHPALPQNWISGPGLKLFFAARLLVPLTNRKHVVIPPSCHGSLSGSRAFYTLNSESSLAPIKSYLE